jgi:glycosidase
MSTNQSKPKYPDTLFGKLGKLSRRASYQTEHLLGLHHFDRVQTTYSEGKADLTLTATTQSQQSFRSVHLVFTLDDWTTRQELDFEKGGLNWDTLTWGWLRTWKADLHLKEGDLLRYYVYANLSDGSTLYADNQATSEGNATQFARWLNPNNVAPEWSKTARIYQIFVDRFNPGENREWLQTDNLLKPFGGTLRGVIEKLDHIQALGFNTIWLTPIFRSPTHHGYDISDYTQIEPRIGTQADLAELISLVHKKGMRILLDFVANHSSDQHPAFLAGMADQDVANSGWFTWTKWPKRYLSYYNVRTMPEFNLHFDSPARAYLLDAAQKWLRMGVDGYRLDYAIGPGRDFWVDFQQACLQINADCWTFGEVVASAEEQTQLAGSMHGTLDFLTCQALRETFATRNWDAARLAGYLQSLQDAFPPGFSRPAFIDNHDMNRFIFTAEGNLDAVHAALSLLYLLPQPPIVYYGTEFDLSQHRSIHDRGASGFDEARLAIPWKTESMPETARLLRELSDFREANPWLTQATWQVISVSADAQQAEILVTSGSHQLKVSIDTSIENPSVNHQQKKR